MRMFCSVLNTTVHFPHSFVQLWSTPIVVLTGWHVSLCEEAWLHLLQTPTCESLSPLTVFQISMAWTTAPRTAWLVGEVSNAAMASSGISGQIPSQSLGVTMLFLLLGRQRKRKKTLQWAEVMIRPSREIILCRWLLFFDVISWHEAF